MFASIREATVYEALPRRALPERLSRPWALALLGIDVLSAFGAAYVAGLPVTIAPASCALVCGAAALCGVYRNSYAASDRDEAYQVVAACALAALPLWIVLHVVGAVDTPQILWSLVIACVFMALLHVTLGYARHADQPKAYPRSAFVTPDAQWSAAHSPYFAVRREVHAAVAVVALVLLSPLLLLAALAILAESRGPVLFRQERVGKSGRHFTLLKFRTMVADAGSSWARPGDARITRVGKFLRRTSIDELPQLINVIRGEMALVGPRPEMSDFVREFRRTIPHYDERHFVPPGITGWAQIQLERNLQPSDMPRVVPYDLFYVEHVSPVLDALIVLKTAVEFLFHRAV